MNWFSVERSLERLVDSVVVALPKIAVGFFILIVMSSNLRLNLSITDLKSAM